LTEPFLLAQISDPHIGATWADADPVAGLVAAVESVRALRPDAVVISGDLADNAADTEYEQLRKLLEPLEAPIYVLAGNHDDRAALRAHFDLPGGGEEPVHYAVDPGPLRLIVLDTSIPGEDSGALGPEQLTWLDAELAAHTGKQVLVAMHHPPLDAGLPAFDEIELAAADRRALAGVLERHPHVRRVVAGHLHRAFAGILAGRTVFGAPSTYVQAQFDLSSHELRFTAEPPGFAVHVVLDGEIVSHALTVLS
jgi:3',5'-cyclic AMP phosphodiesterase CpdA